MDIPHAGGSMTHNYCEESRISLYNGDTVNSNKIKDFCGTSRWICINLVFRLMIDQIATLEYFVKI